MAFQEGFSSSFYRALWTIFIHSPQGESKNMFILWKNGGNVHIMEECVPC